MTEANEAPYTNTWKEQSSSMYLFPSPMCNYIVCVCVCTFSARWRRSAPSLSVLIFSLRKRQKKGFTDSKRPRTLKSVSNTTRETSNDPRETWSDLYHIGYSAQWRARKTCRALLCRSSMLFKRVPRICWEISSWPEWTSTHQQDHQGWMVWMVSGQETIFCWVLVLFPFQFLIP